MSEPAVFLSIVSPVFQAAPLVAELVARIRAAVEPISSQFEIVLVDDRSSDGSWDAILAQHALDNRVLGMRLSRNFGQHYAITAGLERSRGEWVVVMDCDLQDQPEEIPRLLQHAQQLGLDTVLAQRAVRRDSPIKRVLSRSFYRVLSYLTDTDQDPSIANFGIYHRKVINAVLAMRESIRYFPTMVRWVGYRSGSMPVCHAPRPQGRSTYEWWRLTDLALNIILAYSDKPLRLAIKFGLIVAGMAFLMVPVTLFRYLTGRIWAPGYTSLIISIWFFSGLLLSMLGMVGLYIGKTFEQAKKRPLYLVDESIGMDHASNLAHH